MRSNDVPEVLHTRLGAAATAGLVDVLESSQAEWSERVLNLAVERFERRLAQETAGIRVDMAQGFASLRAEFHKDLHEGLAAVRQEIAAVRVDLFKWSFVFWIGQVAVTIGVIAFMLRGIAR